MSAIETRSGRDTGSGLEMPGRWTFAKGVAAVFLEHVRQSVPGYDATHELACAISGLFVRPGGRGYDLGTSTGELLTRLARANAATAQVEWVGYDCEPEMVEAARTTCAERGVANARVELADIAEATYEPCDFVTACLVLHFLPLNRREAALARVHRALRDGGALFIFEKVHDRDARTGNVLEALYYDFKLAQGLRPSEIVNKQRALATVLEPRTSEENTAMLRAAGFRSVATVTRSLCFEGYLAIK